MSENNDYILNFLDVNVRLVNLEELAELKSHYDLESSSQVFLFIRNQKLESPTFNFFSSALESEIMDWVTDSVNGLAKKIVREEDFLQILEVESRISGRFDDRSHDFLIYLGDQNKNFQVFKRLAESNVTFKGFYFCFDWKIGNKILRKFKLTKNSDRDYLVYLRHPSRLLGINQLFEERAAIFNRETFDYFDVRTFFRSNFYDKYVENDDQETGELVNNLYFHGGVAVVFAFDWDDEHKYLEGGKPFLHLKERHMINANHEEVLLRLGHEDQPRVLDDVIEFRKAVKHLPRNVRYLAVDVHNKLGNPLVQLFLRNGTMLQHGSVAIVHVRKFIFFA